MKKLLLLLTCFSLSLSAYAGRPKTGAGFTPGLGDGNTTGSGSGNNTEVTLPVGMPSTGGDATVAPTADAGTSSIVYTFDLSDDNGAASVNQTHSALEKARTLNASCVLIRIDGFAGGWDVAENIRQEILEYDKPVMVFVNNQAVPAASFISSGADSVYTKQGSTISNRNAKGRDALNVNQSKAAVRSEVTTGHSSSVKENVSNVTSEYSNDVTMNEILYKAGLGNLTIVKHDAGFSEKCIGLLSNPLVVMCILIIAGFVLRRVRNSRLPGPMLYLLALMLMIILAPFQLAGLASGIEIAGTLVVTSVLIIASRRKMRTLTGILLFSLALVITAVHLGDISALLIYDSKNTLLAEAFITLLCVFSGWWMGSLKRKSQRSDVNSALMHHDSGVLAV